MRKFYKFLFYKLYRFAVAQEQSVYPVIAFLVYCIVFESLHLLIILMLPACFGVDIRADLGKAFPIIYTIVLMLLNYLVFIRNKQIFVINDYFQSEKYSKGNLKFILYLLTIFIIIACGASVLIKRW